MPTEISGATGVSKVQSSAIETGDLPTGSVVQVVASELNTSFSTNSTDLVDVTGMTVTITPQFSSSKILLSLQCGTMVNGSVTQLTIKLLRGSTIIKENSGYSYPAAGGWNAGIAGFNYLHLDSPNTTSAVTYKLQQENETSGYMHWNYGSNTKGMTVIAQEIAG